MTEISIILLIYLLVASSLGLAQSKVGFEALKPSIHELPRIQEDCEAMGIKEIGHSKVTSEDCEHDAEIVLYGKAVSCETTFQQRANCWGGIVQKIKECVKGRGNTVEAVQWSFAMQFVCNKNLTDRALKASHAISCPPDLCPEKDLKQSLQDLCKGFAAQKLCQLPGDNFCNREENNVLFQEHLTRLGNSLGCTNRESNLGNPAPSKSPCLQFVFLLQLSAVKILY